MHRRSIETGRRRDPIVRSLKLRYMNTHEMSHTFIEEMGDKNRLNKWIFDTIQPYIKGRTMEMGSHGGAISSLFVDHDLPIHLSDGLEGNRQRLVERFRDTLLIRMVHDIDFLREDFVNTYRSSFGAFSTVLAVNITEHGYYNQLALNNAKHLLRLGGHLMIVAPAYTALLNGLEEDLDEWKKHNALVIKEIMGSNVEGLKVRYFNWQALPGLHSRTFGLSTLAIFRKMAL